MADDAVTVSPLTPFTSLPGTFHPLTDQLLGSLLLFLICVGITGNMVSLSFFWATRHNNFPHLLYSGISLVDMVTCLISLPVVPPLMMNRDPILFSNATLCMLWAVLFNLQVCMSMFMVLVLSVTRTIHIVAPFYGIKKRSVVVAVVMYLVYLILFRTACLVGEVWDTKYHTADAHCSIIINLRGMSTFNTVVTYYVHLLGGYLAPPVVVFISLLVVVAHLTKKKAAKRTSMLCMSLHESNGFRRVTVTIALFTGTFLLCNLPFFSLITFYAFLPTLTTAEYNAILGLYTITWYGNLVFGIHLTVLNAVLNPVLYLARMPSFRRWCVKGKLHHPSYLTY